MHATGTNNKPSPSAQFINEPNVKSQTSPALTISRCLNACGGVLILGVCLLMLIDIAGRTLFSLPISGVPEIVALLIALLVFLQLPNSVAERGFIRSELIDGFNGQYAHIMRRTILLLGDVGGVVIFGMVTWALWIFMQKSFDRGTTFGTSGVFEIPQWPVLAALLFCSLLTVLEFSRHIMLFKRREN